jgi:hypothetical protein
VTISLPRLALLAGTLLYLLAGGELVSRFISGYELTSLMLRTRSFSAPASGITSDERRLLQSVTYNSQARPQWFFQPPSPLDVPAIPELETRAAVADPAFMGLENYIWNENFVRRADPVFVKWIQGFKLNNIFAFKGYDSSPFPRYRLYPSTSSGHIATNSYGWLASEVAFEKPPNTVRIGIIGDSTSHSSYGRYLQAYLTSWLNATHRPIKVEVLNAARPAITIDDMLGILRYELGPMQLDYVYLYQGPRVYDHFATLIKAERATAAPPAQSGIAQVKTFAEQHLSLLWRLSALTRVMIDALSGNHLLPEPSKPKTKALVQLPDANRPIDLDEARKIYYLNEQLTSLDRFRDVARQLNITPVATTRRLAVFDGMVLSSQRNLYLYNQLNGEANGSIFWPLTYRQMEHLQSLENRTTIAWAKKNEVPLVDIDGIMPRRPELYTDAFHDTPFAQQLRAWIIFQRLIPLIDQGIGAKLLPKEESATSEKHPYLSQPIMRIEREKIIEHLYPDPAKTELIPLLLSSFEAVAGGSLRTTSSSLAIETSTSRSAYAAVMVVPAEVKKSVSGIVRIRVRVLEGEIALGLTTADYLRPVAFRNVPASPEFQTVDLVAPTLDDVGQVIISNHLLEDGTRSRAEITSVELLRSNSSVPW